MSSMSPPSTPSSSDDFVLQTPEPGSFDGSCIDNLAMPTLSHKLHDRALALAARPSGLEHLLQKKRSATATMSRPAFSPTISEPHAPSTRSSALGPDSAYARYRARSRAKTLASSLPSACETVEAAHAANGKETLAETIAAIREAEEWDWPIPPFVRRPSRPTISQPPQPQEKEPEPELERVEELGQVKPYASEWEPYSMHPFAAARHDAGYAPRRQVRRGSTASLAAQHSGSSLGSGSEGPRTPDECPGSPQFTLVRGPSGLVIKSIGPLTERPSRRYGTPF
ncbi:hypothetical protein CcaverHIS641_0506250 [Cutaneotrichosporon cavernicola]|nr:hypothetical protein CcaverHIS641_0506250 [Cutaneotrichosporon cavernicola]